MTNTLVRLSIAVATPTVFLSTTIVPEPVHSGMYLFSVTAPEILIVPIPTSALVILSTSTNGIGIRDP